MKKISKEQVKATAEAIVSQFIPKDKTADELSFHFTIPPSGHFRVYYRKNERGEWLFESYEEDLNN